VSGNEYDDVLGLGKVSPEVLERSVFSLLPMEAELTLDGGTISLDGKAVIAHSPSIGVPLNALGFFAFHYAASNVAARFGRPRHLVTGIYLPLETRERDLRTISRNLGDEAKRYGVTVVAGQTATYHGLEIPLITTTCIGEPVGKIVRPKSGDRVLILGSVGGEAVWLERLSSGSGDDEFRDYTPLPYALRMHSISGVRLMHDVSEGGVKRALLEVSSANDCRIDVDSALIDYADGAEALGQDVLRAPTYGALVVVVDPDTGAKVQEVCSELDVPVADAGVVSEGEGLYIDEERVEVGRRMAIDEVYGSFRKER
jgi:hydrogenase maturation factor